MNVHVLLRHAHRRVHEVVDPLTAAEWELPDVCGIWSTKQVVAHLTGWAGYFEEFLAPHAGVARPTPHIDDYRALGEDGFNARHGTAAAGLAVDQVCSAYDAVWSRIFALAQQVPPTRWIDAGTLPWDPEGSLDDFAVYGYYGHHYEHAAQIEEFHNRRRRLTHV